LFVIVDVYLFTVPLFIIYDGNGLEAPISRDDQAETWLIICLLAVGTIGKAILNSWLLFLILGSAMSEVKAAVPIC